MTRLAVTRWLLPGLALLASGIFWIAPHPPMVDLPQHAAQVVLLQDLLAGTSPWSDVFTINWLTPYLVGYGITLPLAVVMPVAWAMKTVLSLAFLAFVFACTRVRRHFGTDPRLDAYFLVGFFGFVYEWGLYTFMVAAPIVLAFVVAANRHAAEPSRRSGAAVVALGALLLVSHGMSFAYALAIGIASTLAAAPPPGRRLAAAWPCALLLPGAALLLWNGRRLEALYPTPETAPIVWNVDWHRLPDLAANAITGNHRIAVPAGIAMLLLPWAMGLRIDWRRFDRWIPFAVTTVLLLFLPFAAMRLGFIPNRFGLFLLASYAWMFAMPADRRPRPQARLVAALAVAICCALLAIHAMWAWRFREETAAFDATIARLPAGRRGLGLVYEPYSAGAGYVPAYYHYPVWYQVERGGLVDFNFAWFYVQVVRFRPERMPPVDYRFGPAAFDWQASDAARYDYYFVRRTGGAAPALFAGATCEVTLETAAPPWYVYRRGECR